MTIRIDGVQVSNEELDAIERVAEMAFWQLMLVDDLNHARGLVDLLVDRLHQQIDEIVDASAGCTFDESGELVPVPEGRDPRYDRLVDIQ